MNRTPACHNAPRPDKNSGYFVHVRKYMPDGRYFLEDEWIPYRFTEECRHDGLYSDCNGCKWRKG